MPQKKVHCGLVVKLRMAWRGAGGNGAGRGRPRGDGTRFPASGYVHVPVGGAPRYPAVGRPQTAPTDAGAGVRPPPPPDIRVAAFCGTGGRGKVAHGLGALRPPAGHPGAPRTSPRGATEAWAPIQRGVAWLSRVTSYRHHLLCGAGEQDVTVFPEPPKCTDAQFPRKPLRSAAGMVRQLPVGLLRQQPAIVPQWCPQTNQLHSPIRQSTRRW